MRKTIIECNRCAQHPLDAKRVEQIGISAELLERISGPDPTSRAHPGDPDRLRGLLDLCPPCQEMFVQFMNEGATFVPGTRVKR